VGKKSSNKARSNRTPRSKPVDRLQILQEMSSSVTEAWAKSTNPVKKRIGRLEVAWREGMQWLAEDLQTMFRNFETIGDACDTLDVNIAAVKALCIEKGIFTNEEFAEKQVSLTGLLNKERLRRQAELERLQKEAAAQAVVDADLEAKAAEAAAGAADGSHVTGDLKKMHKAATAAGEPKEIDVPAGATVFGG